MIDEYGVPAFSRMDERTLRAIATAGGGRYYALNPGGQTFQQWHDQNMLTLAKKDLKLDISDYFEWFQLPLFCAILLLFLEPLLRSRAGKKSGSIGIDVVQPETFVAIAAASRAGIPGETRAIDAVENDRADRDAGGGAHSTRCRAERRRRGNC